MQYGMPTFVVPLSVFQKAISTVVMSRYHLSAGATKRQVAYHMGLMGNEAVEVGFKKPIRNKCQQS